VFSRALYSIENHPERINDLERYKNTINVSNISFLVKLSDIPKFKKQNNIQLNIFTYSNNKKEKNSKPYIYAVHLNKNANINLMWIQDKKTNKNHYYVIKNFNKLNSSIIKHKAAKFFCMKCFSHFLTQKNLNLHNESCSKFEYCKIEMPDENHSGFFLIKYINSSEFLFVFIVTLNA
jgi:hypothetical protein